MYRNNYEVRKFVSCVLESIDEPVMLLICGSTAHDEMTKFSDIDGSAFIDSTSWNELNSLKKNFERLAEKKYDQTVNGGFYEPHWSLFLYPKKAIGDKKIFSKHLNDLPVDFTMFNLKHNTKLVYGEDLRFRMPVKYYKNMIDEWASFAPNFHFYQARELVTRNRKRKACYALSRSILQATRIVVWKKAKCITSSYEKIVKQAKNHLQNPLPEWALKKRRNDFKSNTEELEKRLKETGVFFREIIKKHVLEA